MRYFQFHQPAKLISCFRMNRERLERWALLIWIYSWLAVMFTIPFWAHLVDATIIGGPEGVHAPYVPFKIYGGKGVDPSNWQVSLSLVKDGSDQKQLLSTLKFESDGYYRGFIKTIPAKDLELKMRINNVDFPFILRAEVTIALFRPDSDQNADEYEDFMNHAVKLVNEGELGSWPYTRIMPEGLVVKAQTYRYDSNNVSSYFEQYRKMRNERTKCIVSIIGPGDNSAARNIVPVMMEEGYAVTSFQGDVDPEFSDMSIYKTFDRIGTNENYFLYNVFRYLTQRTWKSLTVFQSTNDEFSHTRWDSYTN